MTRRNKLKVHNKRVKKASQCPDAHGQGVSLTFISEVLSKRTELHHRMGYKPSITYDENY